jgi:hypothetical protein
MPQIDDVAGLQLLLVDSVRIWMSRTMEGTFGGRFRYHIYWRDVDGFIVNQMMYLPFL